MLIYKTHNPTGKNPLATKRLYINQAGKKDKQSFSAGKLYIAHPLKLSGFPHLSNTLFSLTEQTTAFVLRGSLRDGIDITKPVHRRKDIAKYQNAPKTVSLQESAQQWICFDIDKLLLALLDYPSDTTLKTVNPQELFDRIIAQYAPELNGVSYHYQYSSSAGWTKTNTVSAHLWFWLDRPMTNPECKAFVQYINERASFQLFDPALYQAAQPHFTANPILGQGVTNDPLPARSGVIWKKSEELALPEIHSKKANTTTSTNRIQNNKPTNVPHAHNIKGWIKLFKDCKENLHNLSLVFWYWAYGQSFWGKEKINRAALKAIQKSPRINSEPERFTALIAGEWQELRKSAEQHHLGQRILTYSKIFPKPDLSSPNKWVNSELNKKITIIDSPHGTGKTQWIKKNTFYGQCNSSLTVSPRRSLAKSNALEFTTDKAGFQKFSCKLSIFEPYLKCGYWKYGH